jgi:hypothetical protein
MRRTALAIALVVSFVILVGGYFAAVAPAEASIAATREQTESLQNRILADQEFVRDFPIQQAARKKQLASLRPINLHANPSQMVSQFVADMDHSVRHNGVGFMSAQLSPSAPAPAGTPNPNATPSATLVPTGVHMTIQGTYAQILTAVAATSRASTLTRVNQVSFRRHTASDASNDPTLDADVVVTLYSVLFPPPAMRVIPDTVAPGMTLPATGPRAPGASAALPAGTNAGAQTQSTLGGGQTNAK